jgi:hypothetical protein
MKMKASLSHREVGTQFVQAVLMTRCWLKFIEDLNRNIPQPLTGATCDEFDQTLRRSLHNNLGLFKENFQKEEIEEGEWSSLQSLLDWLLALTSDLGAVFPKDFYLQIQKGVCNKIRRIEVHCAAAAGPKEECPTKEGPFGMLRCKEALRKNIRGWELASKFIDKHSDDKPFSEKSQQLQERCYLLLAEMLESFDQRDLRKDIEGEGEGEGNNVPFIFRIVCALADDGDMAKYFETVNIRQCQERMLKDFSEQCESELNRISEALASRRGLTQLDQTMTYVARLRGMHPQLIEKTSDQFSHLTIAMENLTQKLVNDLKSALRSEGGPNLPEAARVVEELIGAQWMDKYCHVHSVESSLFSCYLELDDLVVRARASVKRDGDITFFSHYCDYLLRLTTLKVFPPFQSDRSDGRMFNFKKDALDVKQEMCRYVEEWLLALLAKSSPEEVVRVFFSF